MTQAERAGRPTDYLQTEFVSLEQDTHGYIDWAPSDLPEPIETPEVITL